MNMIVAVDDNWGIGKNNGLLASVPGDMAFFKYKTMDHVVVMGRKTLESLPNRRGLFRRTNYVLTSNPDFEAERCIIVHSDEELLKELEQYPPDEVFLIGGASMYNKLYPLCDKLYITKLEGDFGADTFITNIDEDDRYEVTVESDVMEDDGIRYRICTYERKK